MSKADRSRMIRAHAGRAGVGLALAATTAVGVAVPAAQAHAAPAPLHRGVALPGTVHSALPGAVSAAAPQITYQVRQGDTVSHLAQRTGASVGAIVRANNLDAQATIRVGQMLKIPSAAAAPSVAPASTAPAGGTHKVAAGETVSGLAKRYGTTVSALVEANGLDPRALIYVGQTLRLPGATAAPVSAAVTAVPAAAPTADPRTPCGPGTPSRGSPAPGGPRSPPSSRRTRSAATASSTPGER